MVRQGLVFEGRGIRNSKKGKARTPGYVCIKLPQQKKMGALMRPPHNFESGRYIKLRSISIIPSCSSKRRLWGVYVKGIWNPSQKVSFATSSVMHTLLLSPIHMRISTWPISSPSSAGDRLTTRSMGSRSLLFSFNVKPSFPPATAPFCSFNG